MQLLLRITIISLIGYAASTFHVRASEEKSAKGVAGMWHGAFIITPKKFGDGYIHLRLILRIKEEAEGHYSGVLDSPDERLAALPLSDVTLSDNRVRFVFKRVTKAVFEGAYDADKKEIKGTWKGRHGTTPVTFRRTPVIRRPQEPVKPYPYLEEEVAYENKKGKARLTGTLTLPRTGGPFPAVLLITASGQQDRDQSGLSHRPFHVIADYITRRGIAVLRVDDRGIGGSTGEVESATTADFAEDALAGVEFLKSRKEIDQNHIGLIGHSEGATIATMVAAESKDVAFIVMLAGMGVRGDEMYILNIQAQLEASGVGKKEIDRQRVLNEKLVAIAKDEKDPAVAKKKLQQVMDDEIAKVPWLARVLQGDLLKAQAEAQVNVLTSPWFRYVLNLDPKPLLMKVQCPVLVLNGDKDRQVTPKENLPAVEAALKAGGNKDYTIKELPNLNHFFQTCKTGAGSEYAQIEETFALSALELIGDWILERTAKK